MGLTEMHQQEGAVWSLEGYGRHAEGRGGDRIYDDVSADVECDGVGEEVLIVT